MTYLHCLAPIMRDFPGTVRYGWIANSRYPHRMLDNFRAIASRAQAESQRGEDGDHHRRDHGPDNPAKRTLGSRPVVGALLHHAHQPSVGAITEALERRTAGELCVEQRSREAAEENHQIRPFAYRPRPACMPGEIGQRPVRSSRRSDNDRFWRFPNPFTRQLHGRAQCCHDDQAHRSPV